MIREFLCWLGFHGKHLEIYINEPGRYVDKYCHLCCRGRIIIHNKHLRSKR